MLPMRAVMLPFILTMLHLSPSTVSAVNCCSLNDTELRGLDPNPSCPVEALLIVEKFSVLSDKCDECPDGTCRVDMDCYCPTDFLKTAGLCVYSFGVNWPQSIDKEDTIWRSCSKEPPQTNNGENCCSLTKEQLEARVGTSHDCPTRSIIVTSVRDLEKCERCPFGTCRVGLACYCPKDFLEDDMYQVLCRPSFTKRWDESIELEDRHWRSCVRPTPTQAFTFDNCCALSNEQLEIRVGTNGMCPLFFTSLFLSLEALDKECDPCPFGACRAASNCYCPQDFLDSKEQRGLCRESFGEFHPDSVGKPDTRCPNNPTPQVLSAPPRPNPTPSQIPVVTTSITPSNTPGMSSSPVPTQSSSNSPNSDVSSDSVGNLATPQVDKESESSEDGEKLTTAEIVGIVIGSVTGIISALGVIVAWCACFRKKDVSVDLFNSDREKEAANE